jgi:hypothetical protein
MRASRKNEKRKQRSWLPTFHLKRNDGSKTFFKNNQMVSTVLIDTLSVAYGRNGTNANDGEVLGPI